MANQADNQRNLRNLSLTMAAIAAVLLAATSFAGAASGGAGTIPASPLVGSALASKCPIGLPGTQPNNVTDAAIACYNAAAVDAGATIDGLVAGTTGIKEPLGCWMWVSVPVGPYQLGYSVYVYPCPRPN
jgi:hypothetical protein